MRGCPGTGASDAAQGRAVVPTTASGTTPPTTVMRSLTSVRAHFARITNMRSRLRVAGNTLASMTNQKRSGAVRHTHKLANMRPLGEQ